MPRKQNTIKLPPLREVFPSFTKFEAGENHQRIITNLIRECCTGLQQNEALIFYTVREIASFFNVSLRTVALSYATLDREGILSRVRGSRTMLTGKKLTPQQPVHAVVGLPIRLQSLITSPFECRLQMAMEESLRSRGFVADSIFFRIDEECDPDFTTRLARHNLDVVIWYSPHPLSSHILMSLRDKGIRLVLLQPSEMPLGIPSRTHLLEWRIAYRAMAKQWAADGIGRIFVPTPEHLLSLRALKQLKPILEEFGMEMVPIQATESSLSLSLLEQHSPERKDVLAFMDTQTADALCNGYPELLENILDCARVAFCRGSVRVPRLITKRARVDVVELDPEVVAKEVVKDLCNLTQKQENTRLTFEAEFYPQVIMGSVRDL